MNLAEEKSGLGEAGDWTDELAEAWAREHPEADVAPLPPLVRLARLGILIDAFQTRMLQPFGLTPADYTVLAALRRVGAPYRSSPSQLYSVLHRSSGGMSKMLKRLEERRLVERFADPHDGRGSLVGLTEAGVAMQEKVFTDLLNGTHELLAPVSPGQLADIDQSLRVLLDAFESRGPR
jgi:DNA-binding MarR family transcriptional regulator